MARARSAAMRAGQRSVGEVMRRRFIALDPEDSLFEAERLMRMARVRVLPVAEGGALVGSLSHRELLASSLAPLALRSDAATCARWLTETSVGDLMRREPLSVTPGTPLAEAVARLLAAGGGCLPVVLEGGVPPRLVGLVTESDLLRAAYEPLGLPGRGSPPQALRVG